MNVSPLLRSSQAVLSICRNINCWSAGITKKHRKLYIRTYPTFLILPDGSSINVDYTEPRKIISLPLDISTLSKEERQIRIAARTPLSKIKIMEEIEDDFDESEFYRVKN
ncbi:39S ribosomal protein L55, mitochondrial [Hylaeus volcanicus]|uniref:39S ribosomal protein L55, mitochondrial n=1 Tax=Hylaeus volcanicus TaxID=313075 RepID=UPI0023B87FCB|nr:39S ribosomal protein L55, mitochondrial [Hylaeus volcanicus]